MDVLSPLVESFQKHADADNAASMQAYMKNRFSFLGLKSPVRKELQKPLMKQSAAFSRSRLITILRDLWGMEEREYQYVACEILRRRLRLLGAPDLPLLKELVLTKSWWDTVDSLAGTIGDFMVRHPSLQPKTTDEWMAGQQMWLQRVALIHQLKYREGTDWEMLQRYVVEVATSKEFFLQKGAGWALRQYSKFYPDRVAEFLARHSLSGITVREASKYI